MSWELRVARRARKALERAPERDQQHLLAALQGMRDDPLSGDIARIESQPAAWRRRIGDWRIFFDLDPERRVVDIIDIRRRASTTYRRR